MQSETFHSLSVIGTPEFLI